MNFMNYTPDTLAVASFAVLLLLGGCFDPDPRSIEGAIEAASLAIEAGDSKRLYGLIDVRSRHAMEGIAKARSSARALVSQDYPEGQRAPALAQLGPAVENGAAIFAARCDAGCRAEIAAKLGPPTEVERDGKKLRVHTARGTTLDMYTGAQWHGIVWRTDALTAELDRVSQALRQIEDNAATYRRRAELAAGSAVGGSAEAATDAASRGGKPAAGSDR